MGPAQFPQFAAGTFPPRSAAAASQDVWVLEGFVGLRLGLESKTPRAQNHHQIGPGLSGFHGVTMATNFYTRPALH